MKTTKDEESIKKARIHSFRIKIQICQKVIDSIQPDDPYRDLRIKSMERRIEIYTKELNRITPPKIRNLKDFIENEVKYNERKT